MYRGRNAPMLIVGLGWVCWDGNLCRHLLREHYSVVLIIIVMLTVTMMMTTTLPELVISLEF